MSADVPEVQRCGHTNKVRHKNNRDAYRKLVDVEKAKVKAAYGPELEDMNTLTQSRLHLACDGVTYRSDPVRAPRGSSHFNGEYRS